MSRSARYIDSLTPLRGFAALWVMMFHIDGSLYYRNMGSLLPRHLTGILSHGYLWVDFFFMLSGFIMAHVFGDDLANNKSGQSVANYLWSRFTRIYPLHLFCLGLVILIAVLYPIWIPNVRDDSWRTFMSWAAIPSNLLLTHAMYQQAYLSWDIVSWSIGAEWWTYVATIPLVIALHRSKPVTGILVMAFCSLCLAGLVYILPHKNLDTTFSLGFCRCLFEFVFGLGLYRLYKAGWLENAPTDGLLAACLGSLILIFHFQLNDLLILPVFSLLILAASRNKGRFERLMRVPFAVYLGRISYSIYLVHGVVFSAFWFVLPWLCRHFRLVGFSPLQKLAYVTAFVSLVLALSHFTYRFVENPARIYLRTLRSRQAQERIA